MIRYRLKELIADKEFTENRRITIQDISESTGISRPTLSRIANKRGYSSSTDVLDRLCSYFSCRIEDLVQYIDEDI